MWAKNNDVLLDVHALRSTKNTLVLPIQKNIYTYEEMDMDYDVIFITNPTAEHWNTFLKIKDKTKHLFIEKPVFDQSHYLMQDVKIPKNSVYYVAAPLRYHPVLRYLKEELYNHSVYSVRAICSTYLPNWRPKIDYRRNYSAYQKLGGGVSLDCIHEWDYLTYLFGFPGEVLHFKGKFSHLEISSDDLSVYIGKYPDKLIELHLDYFGIKDQRYVEIHTADECLVGDFINYEIRYLKSGNKVSFSEDKNEIYIRELNAFFDMINGTRKNDNDIFYANRVLKLSEGDK